MKKPSVITCIGEILWDALPEGLFLGGAPLNVGLHLHELDMPVAMISRVGKDRLGMEALERIERSGLATDLIQLDENYETGFVKVQLDEHGDPEYEILQPAAWDYIDIKKPAVTNLLDESWAVVYGTLAHRMNSGLRALGELDCLKVLDMNLRPPHFKKENVLGLVEKSDILKMNEEELKQVCRWCDLDGDIEKVCREVASRFNCSTVCVTRGGKGAALLHQGEWFLHKGYRVKVADAVGAGDAFLAALLFGIQKGERSGKLLPFANAAGAYVASRSGANPGYSCEILEKIVNSGTV